VRRRSAEKSILRCGELASGRCESVSKQLSESDRMISCEGKIPRDEGMERIMSGGGKVEFPKQALVLTADEG
jgi:hypothetical protein